MDQEWGLVFVYGTLKRGQANHLQLGGAPFAGVATMPGLELHHLGPFPMAIDGEGMVQGEVYRLSDNPFQLAFWQSHFWGGIGLCQAKAAGEIPIIHPFWQCCATLTSDIFSDVMLARLK